MKRDGAQRWPTTLKRMLEPKTKPADSDVRRPFRIVVDILATTDQVQQLKTLIGEAICAAPDEHPGPCRIAWSMSSTGGDNDALDGSYGLDADEAAFIREQLEPVVVWTREEVDRSLKL